MGGSSRSGHSGSTSSSKSLKEDPINSFAKGFVNYMLGGHPYATTHRVETNEVTTYTLEEIERRLSNGELTTVRVPKSKTTKTSAIVVHPDEIRKPSKDKHKKSKDKRSSKSKDDKKRRDSKSSSKKSGHHSKSVNKHSSRRSEQQSDSDSDETEDESVYDPTPRHHHASSKEKRSSKEREMAAKHRPRDRAETASVHSVASRHFKPHHPEPEFSDSSEPEDSEDEDEDEDETVYEKPAPQRSQFSAGPAQRMGFPAAPRGPPPPPTGPAAPAGRPQWAGNPPPGFAPSGYVPPPPPVGPAASLFSGLAGPRGPAGPQPARSTAATAPAQLRVEQNGPVKYVPPFQVNVARA